MQLILESDDVRTKKIIIPNKATYERALELTDEKYHNQFVTWVIITSSNVIIS